MLSNSSFPDFTVTVSDVTANVFKLKKKKSRGVDGLCALHLVNGTRLLYEMLTLLYQIIFVVGIVPDVFCRGQLTPILKKGKPANICSSYRPITVSPVLCKLFEMLILPNVRNCCQMPNYQFGFTVGLGCADALFALATILSDSEATGDPLVIGSFDVSRAFDSSAHAQILLFF